MNKNILYFGIALDVVIVDQITKIWATTLGGPIPIFGKWLQMTYAENTGIAFSIPLEGLLLQVITVVFIIALLIVGHRMKALSIPWLGTSFALIVGGAVGNALDRIFREYVIDFISVGSFPIFNIADSAVTIGVVMLILYELKRGRSVPK